MAGFESTDRAISNNSPKGDDQSDWIEQQLVLICQSLLQRPFERRGPFLIPDNELRILSQRRNRSRVRLVTAG